MSSVGTAKGVICLVLPTVILALLTVAIDLSSAMVLPVVPSFVTNLWQATVGGHGQALPFLIMATSTNGVFTGMLGIVFAPGVMYLQGIGCRGMP